MSKNRRVEYQKMCKKIIRETAKVAGGRTIDACYYTKINEYFITSLAFVCFIDGKHEIHFRTEVKPYAYDNIFWDVIDMSDNAKQPESLRANGAFVSPSVQIVEIPYCIDDDSELEQVCKKGILEINEIGSEFISQLEFQ